MLVATTLPTPLDNAMEAGRRFLEPFGAVGRGAGRFLTDPVGTVADSVVGALVRGIADACGRFGSGVLSAVTTSAGIDFRHGWWAGDRGQELVRTVGMLSASLMVCFLLLALIQGLYAGDPMIMMRAAALEVPASVFGMTAVVIGAELLIRLTDAASSAVLAGAGDGIGRFLGGFGAAASIATLGFAAVVMLLLFLVGALLVWVELVIRASLIYLLVAAAPLFLAARVWPAAKGAFRKLCELGVALIISKFFIALALALGAAALGGGGPKDGLSTGEQVGTDLAGLLMGATLMLLAAFAPFIVLKILPVLEAAVVAQGISRGPWRTAQTGMQTTYYAQGLGRLAGRGGRPGGGASGGEGGGDGGGGPAAGGGTEGGTGGGPASGTAADGGSTAAAGAAGVVVAGAVKAGSAAAKKGGEVASDTAEASKSTGQPDQGPRSTTEHSGDSGSSHRREPPDGGKQP